MHSTSIKHLTFRIFLSISTLTYLTACNSQPEDPTHAVKAQPDFSEIQLNPDSARKDLTTNQFLDSISYLPLQTTEQSMFGEINQMEITSKYYVIWDESSNSILLFLKNGSFYKRIDNTDPRLKTPFKRIEHFTVNEKKNEIVFSDSQTFNTYIYDLNGDYVKTVDTPPFHGTAYASIGEYNVYYQGYSRFSNTAKAIPSNLVFAKDNQISAEHLPFDTLAVDPSDLFSAAKSFFDNKDGKVFFTAPYDYNVYSIDQSANLLRSYRLVLPAVKSLPNDFMSNTSYRDKRIKYTTGNFEVIYSITDFYANKNILTFSLIGHGGNNGYIYNTATNTLISLSNYVADKKSYMLPISSGMVHAKDENGHFICSVTASRLFQSKRDLEMNGVGDHALPDLLKKFYESNNLQNPVLTLLSVKQKI